MNVLFVHAALLGLGSFLITYFLIPKIILIAKYKNLNTDPNERSSHHIATPNIGGMAFFAVLMLAFFFMRAYDDLDIRTALIPGITILFFVGLKDDLMVLSPLTKLVAQFAASVILVIGYVDLTRQINFLGLGEIPIYIGLMLLVLVMVTIINAFNLIDGIDGLAASIAIIMFVSFSIMFYVIEFYFFFLLSVCLIGTLIAFLRFNLSDKKKIFMGDTGSMILGFIIGAMTISVLCLDNLQLHKLPLKFENLPIVLLVILIIPLFDTARVFWLRIIKKKSPFSADRNHIHHVVIDYYHISHRRASFVIGLANFLIVLLFTFLSVYTDKWSLVIFFLCIILMAVVFFFVLTKPRIIRDAYLKTLFRNLFLGLSKRLKKGG